MREKIEQTVIGLTAIFSIIVAVLDWLKLLPLPIDTVPSLTLLGIGLIAGYLVLERRNEIRRTDKRISTLENRYSQVSAFFDAIKADDNFAEIKLIYGLRNYAKLISDAWISVDQEHALVLWRDCISRCKRWHTVSYAMQEETWETGWGNAISLGIQQERISAGGSIKRVFIVDDEDEFKRLLPIMEKQKSIGVNVKWLMKTELLKNRRVRELTTDLGTIDVTIVDDSWIFRVYLDKKTRHIRGADAVRDTNSTESVDFIFNEAFDRGSAI